MQALAIVFVFVAALGIPQRKTPTPSTIIVQEGTLKGVKAMSVWINVEGINDISADTYRADIEKRLRSVGITVLPTTENPRTYPCLVLTVNADFLRSRDGNLFGSLAVWTLELMQLFPRPGSPTVQFRGTTWSISGRVIDRSVGIAAALRKAYLGGINDFVDDYGSVNGAPSSSVTEPTPKIVGGVATYDYGESLESFVPPVPSPTDSAIRIEMTKQRRGSLSFIVVEPFGFSTFNQLTGGALQDWQRSRPDLAKMMMADFNEALQDPVREGAAYRPGASLILSCNYLADGGPVNWRVYFWFKTRPPSADPVKLKARSANHPLLKIKGPLQTCPATFDLAEAAR